MLTQIRFLSSVLLIFVSALVHAQDTILPMNFNGALLKQALVDNERIKNPKDKSGIPLKIYVDLDSSKFILVDDFSYNSYRPYDHYWQDRSVYINRNFAINPVTVGVATFDGMDEYGYPYNFITPTSYGACDTLTSLPIELNTVDRENDDPIYLSFSFQPQGLSPFSPSDEDSITLEFFQPYRYDTTTWNVGGVLIDSIDSIRVDRWFRVWGQSGYDLNASDKGCNFAFRNRTIAVPPYLYQDSFQFRFVSYGNTSGNVDQWHLDFVVLSSDDDGHTDLGDYSFIWGLDTLSMIKEYEAMPWFHYRGNESRYARTRRLDYYMRNSYGEDAAVDIEYYAFDPNGVVRDSIVNAGSAGNVPLKQKSCRVEKLPLVGDPNHTFTFANPTISDNTTTFFMVRSRMILQNIGAGAEDIIELNNQVDEYQVFGSYYAYDDGSAEAGYGVKSRDGKLAIQFIMSPGIEDTLTSLYIHFNPVVVDRSNQRFRLTVWDDDGTGFPGDIIYENSTVGTPEYPSDGVNVYHKWKFDEPVMVSDTFYVGYQKLTEDVLNLGYDLNNNSNEKIFISLGGSWQQGVSVTRKGSVMIRPSFRNLKEPVMSVKEVKKVASSKLKIYPNPTSSSLNYLIDSESFASWTGQVLSIDGRLINTFYADPRGQLDVSYLTEGLYLLLLRNEESGERITQKFLIKR